ncbi:hypothetical protein HDU67_000822, partial [Dinochytrium kinnereticum]
MIDREGAQGDLFTNEVIADIHSLGSAAQLVALEVLKESAKPEHFPSHVVEGNKFRTGGGRLDGGGMWAARHDMAPPAMVTTKPVEDLQPVEDAMSTFPARGVGVREGATELIDGEGKVRAGTLREVLEQAHPAAGIACGHMGAVGSGGGGGQEVRVVVGVQGGTSDNCGSVHMFVEDLLGRRPMGPGIDSVHSTNELIKVGFRAFVTSRLEIIHMDPKECAEEGPRDVNQLDIHATVGGAGSKANGDQEAAEVILPKHRTLAAPVDRLEDP